MKTHTSSFKEQIKLMGKEIDSRITFGSTVLGKDDLNAVTPSYQGAILKSVMKQLDIDSNVEIPIGTILKYEFGLKVNGKYEYINYGNYVVYNIEKQEDTNSYKITCYDKLLYSMLDYVKLPITYPISIRDYINAISTTLGLKFANKSGTFANYSKQIQADLYDGLGYTFRDILDELAQVTASTICLNNNDELEIRYITETGDTIDEEFLKDVNVNFGEKFGTVNTIVLSRSGDSDSVYYPSVLPTNPYEIKISDNQIMNGNDRADFLPDIYNKLNGLEFYTNDFVSTGIIYYDLCDRYSVKVGDNTYSCVMFNDEVLVTQGLEENVYTELPEQTETDYKHASKDDRMINQVYIIAKKNEAEILALVSTTETIQKEINPTKDESGSDIYIEDASNNPLTYLEIEGKSEQTTRSGKNKFDKDNVNILNAYFSTTDTTITANAVNRTFYLKCDSNTTYAIRKINSKQFIMGYTYELPVIGTQVYGITSQTVAIDSNNSYITITTDSNAQYLVCRFMQTAQDTLTQEQILDSVQVETGAVATEIEKYGASPSPDYPSEIRSVGYENLYKIPATETKNGIKLTNNGNGTFNITGTATANTTLYMAIPLKESRIDSGIYTISCKSKGYTAQVDLYGTSWLATPLYRAHSEDKLNATATINITSDVTTVRCIIYIPSGGTINLTNETIQLEKGSVAHPIIPYGKYGIEIINEGKNKFDINSITENYLYEDGGVFTATTAYNTSDYILCKSNKFIVSAKFTANSPYIRYVIAEFDENKTYIQRQLNTDSSSPKYTFTLNSNTKYIRLCYRRDATLYDIQLEEGTIVTEYKPYFKKSTVFVLDKPLRSLPNGVKDITYIRNNKLYVDRYVGSVVLNGSESWATDNITGRYITVIDGSYPNMTRGVITSTHFIYMPSGNKIGGGFNYNSRIFLYPNSDITTIDAFKTWLSIHNTQVDYELAEPYAEEIGEIKMPSTFKGVNHISTTDKLEPIINLTYVRDTVIADYVENHVTELKLTENEIKASVKSVSSSVDGLNTTINRVEEITNDNSQVINVISTNIDKTSGEVREVTTTTGFTFNADGMTIDDGSGFKAEHTANGAYYKDGNSIVGQYTKDGSKQKDLELFGTYSYGKESINDTPMFVGQLYTDANGERGFGHFYNGEG